MPSGYVNRPTTSQYMAAMKGGGNSPFRFPFFKGRKQGGGGGGVGKRKKSGRRGRKKQLSGKGLMTMLAKIPNLFRSAMGRKIISTLGTAGGTAGVNMMTE